VQAEKLQPLYTAREALAQTALALAGDGHHSKRIKLLPR